MRIHPLLRLAAAVSLAEDAQIRQFPDIEKLRDTPIETLLDIRARNLAAILLKQPTNTPYLASKATILEAQQRITRLTQPSTTS